MPAYAAVVNIILSRMRRLGFTNSETGLVDGADAEAACYEALLDLLGHYDLDGFTVINTSMFTTSVGVDSYALPTNFGRFIVPVDKDRYGLTLNNGSTDVPLAYRMPDEWFRLKSSTNGRPGYFTITDTRKLRLDPPPDSNGGGNYVAKGVYIRDVPATELDANVVPLEFAMCLKDMALASIAGDMGSPKAAMLLPMAARSMTTLANGQQRLRTPFQRQNTQIGRRRWF